MKVYSTRITGQVPRDPRARTLMGIAAHVTQCEIVMAAPTKKACLDLARAMGLNPSVADVSPATGFQIDAMRAAGLFDEPAVYAMRMHATFGSGIVKVTGPTHVELVGRFDGNASGYRVVSPQGAALADTPDATEPDDAAKEKVDAETAYLIGVLGQIASDARQLADWANRGELVGRERMGLLARYVTDAAMAAGRIEVLRHSDKTSS